MNIISDIMTWFNQNAGFLAFCTVIISIIIPVYTGKLPFKKQLKISFDDSYITIRGFGGESDKTIYQGFFVSVHNSGNKSLFIKCIYLQIGKDIIQQNILFNGNGERYKELIPEKEFEHLFNFQLTNNIEELKKFKQNSNIYVVVEYTTGKIKKKITTCKKIIDKTNNKSNV